MQTRRQNYRSDRCNSVRLDKVAAIPSNVGMLTPDSEYRRCPVTGRWVVVAPIRASRPLTLDHAAPHHRDGNHAADCPFCEGREQETPHERFALRNPGSLANGPGWSLRVCPNKFPAVTPMQDTGHKITSVGELFEFMPGVGEHELVIECARHEANPVRLGNDEFRDVLLAYRQRLLTHAADPRLAYAMVFKNVGAEAGASLAHLHSQIVATPIVPDAIRLELEAANDYYQRERRCVYCDVLRQERAAKVRIVVENEWFTAITPFAPRFAYEMWVMPNRHTSHFETISELESLELAKFLKRILGAMDRVLHEPAFNYFVHTGPLRANVLPYFHWHIEVIPRTSRPAGFEWGSGCFITAISPERAAEELRATVV